VGEQEPRDIETLVEDLDENHGQQKEYADKLKVDKKEFFEWCTEQVKAEGDLAEKLVEMRWYDGEDQSSVVERIERHYPGWTIDAWREVAREALEAILVEDPAAKSYTYISDQGRVFTRKAVSGSVLVDEEWMLLDNPDLYNEITFELPWGERTMPPVETLTAKQAAAIQKYLYKGPGKVQMAAPRDAKPEELVGE
jgi:hypothetical protein